MESSPLIDPELGIRLTLVFSWILVVLGVGKMILYGVGEFFPQAFQKVKSEGVRKFLTGTGNRLLFGLGGFLTALFGGFGLLAAQFMRWVLSNSL